MWQPQLAKLAKYTQCPLYSVPDHGSNIAKDSVHLPALAAASAAFTGTIKKGPSCIYPPKKRYFYNRGAENETFFSQITFFFVLRALRQTKTNAPETLSYAYIS
jgi:hypothetical protein